MISKGQMDDREARIKHEILAGDPVVFDPLEAKGARTIAVSWLVEALGKGLQVKVTNGIIIGPLRLTDTVIQSKISLVGCRFDGPIEINRSLFKQTLDFAGTVFRQEVDFSNTHIQGNLYFQGAEFDEEAVFDRLQVDGDLSFGPDDQGNPVEFNSDTSFLGSRIRGYAYFDGAEFHGDATFNGIMIDGRASFAAGSARRAAVFSGDAEFYGAEIHGDLDFSGSLFEADANFDNFRVSGQALFRADDQGRPVVFAGDAHFPFALFGSNAWFLDAKFRKSADFMEAEFGGRVSFTNAVFGDGNDGEAGFFGARFRRGATFQAASFGGPAEFSQSTSDLDARFEDARFLGRATFVEAKFEVAYFGVPADSKNYSIDVSKPTMFQQTIDLRGFTYNRIYLDLDNVLRKIAPYDRQPFSQLEKVLIDGGQDEQADKVYIERRLAERARISIWQDPGHWLADWVYKCGANYGVRPYRLVFFSFLLLALGMLVFTQAGAVESKPEESEGTKNDAPRKPIQINWPEAIEVSLHSFLPVDLPIGSRWIPAVGPVKVGYRQWYFLIHPHRYASLLRLSGWVLVPIGIAALTGLLRHIAS